MSSADLLVPLAMVDEKLFLRGDEPPVRGMTDILPSLDILGDGREGFAFASRGANAARCFVGEAFMVGVCFVGRVRVNGRLFSRRREDEKGKRVFSQLG